MFQRITTTFCFATVASIGLMLPTAAQAMVNSSLNGYWSLDETDTGSTVVTSGGGYYNDGINVGADLAAEGIIGTAYDFETDDEDWVNFNAPGTNLGANMTFAAFVKPESLRTDLTGANSRNGVLFSDSSYYGFGTAQGRLHMLLHDGTTYQDHISGAAGTVAIGVYQHIAAATSIVPDGGGMYTSTVKFYIDGIHVDTVVRTVNSDTRGTKDMTIANAGVQRKWDGLIDEAAIWSSTLTDQEIALINGLARFAQVTAGNAAIDDVMTAFSTGTGGSASAGGYTWNYTTSLGAGPVGTIGGSVGASDAFIILDASGNGVQIAAAALHPGDANGDGMVNLADLQILGDNWQSSTASWSEADFTGDGNVNLADLQIIGDNWGFGTGSDLSFDEALAGVAIPEPASLCLLGLTTGLLLLRR